MFETLESRRLLAATATVTSGTLTVTGTPQSDAIKIIQTEKNLVVRVGTHQINKFTATSVTKIVVNAGKGNDSVLLDFTTLSTPATISGGLGDDTIRTSGGADSINGNAGNDNIYSSAGNDTVNGNEGYDTISGGAGNDLLIGGTGNDSLIGGSGADTLRGSAGHDDLSGGKGIDLALTEEKDTLAGIETHEAANSFVPAELPEAKLAIATTADTTGKIITCTLTFTGVAADSEVSATWDRVKGNTFYITADVQRNTENLAPTAATKVVKLNFGKQNPGTYNILVYSGTGLTQQTGTFTVTWVVPTP
jgi:hypothetical protein